MVFGTPRLAGRLINRQDAPALTCMLCDPEVMKYSVRGVCDEAATLRFIDWCLECYAVHGVGPWALVEKNSGELAGFCGVGPELVSGTEELNLGYRLARRFWGQGLATEAAVGALRYAFECKRIASVVVITEADHTASIRVAEKAGFRRYSALEFHCRAVRVYRMSADDRKLLCTT